MENLGPRADHRGPNPGRPARPHRRRPPSSDAGHPAGFPRGFRQSRRRTTAIDRIDGPAAGWIARPRASSPTRWVRGGADRRDGLAPWPAASRDGRGSRARGSLRPGRRVGPSRCSLTIRWLVTQARQPSKCGSGTIHFSTNSGPLRIARSLPEARGRRVARRRGPRQSRGTDRAARSVVDGRGRRAPSSDRVAARARRPDRRGQAPKGTGGMPRRHQQYGRGRLRKVRGSCRTSVDPGMPVETRGTETSQYPEEKKATATPSVAASERGPA